MVQLSQPYVKVKVSQSCLTFCDPYSPWNSPGQNTGVGSLYLLQRSSQQCRWILYQLSNKGSRIHNYWEKT